MKFLTWLGKIPKWIWESLEQKGRYTSLVGITIVVSSVVKPLIQHNKGVTFDEQYLWQIIYFVICGVILIILPSYIKISKEGFEIKD